MHKFYNVDEQLKTHPDFKKIEKALDNLCNSSTFEKLAGQCVSACDILQNILLFYGVQSKIMECQMMAVKENPKIKEFCFVGFDYIMDDGGDLDSHVILVTQTEVPIIIDASIGYLLPENDKILVRVLDNLDPEIIGKFLIDDVTLTYHHKKNLRLPSLHQKNLIDRIKEEKQLSKKIKIGTKIIIVIGIVTGINFIANFTLLGFEVYKLLLR